MVLLLVSCKHTLDPIQETPIDEPVIDEYKVFNIYTDSITLEWDGESRIYNVYYKIHLSNDWVFIAQVEDNSIIVNKIGTGKFDFGVSNGDSQEIHSSLDNTAIPENGWYINW